MIVISRVGLYCRVSSEEQQERGTIQNQVEFAEKYCDLHKIELTERYIDDGVTGTIPLQEREKGALLLDDAINGKLDLLLIYKLDRLGRSARIILNSVHELENYGVKIRSMTEPFDTGDPNGRFLLTILAAVADLDRETTLERMWLGANRAARSGKWLGGIIPYGYSVNEERFLEVNEDLLPGINMSEADVVRMIYKLVCEQKMSTIKVADYLNSLGVPPSYTKDGRKIKKGKRKVNTAGIWSPNQIGRMIANTTYKGIHYFGKRTLKKDRELIAREVPAIVSEESWEKARQVLKDNQLESCKNAKRQYLLRGLIKCNYCGSTYHGTSHKGRVFYICNGKTKYMGPGQTKCTAKNVPQNWIEGLVWEDCSSFIRNPGELLKEIAENLHEKENSKEEIMSEKKTVLAAISEKDSEKQRVLDLYRKKIIGSEDVEKQLSLIDFEKKTLMERADQIDVLMNAEDVSTNKLDSVRTLLGTLREKIESNLFYEVRREVVKLLVQKVVIETRQSITNRLQAVANVHYTFPQVVPHTDRGSPIRQK